MGRTTPRVSLWFTASRANIEELPAFVQLAADLGVAEVYVQRLVFNGLGLATEANALHGRLRERELSLLAEAEALATRHGIAMRASGLTSPLASLQAGDDGARPWSGCQRPWTLAYVTANGNVLPCCISPWVARDYARADPRQRVQRGLRVDLGRQALSAVPNRLRDRHPARPVPRLRAALEHLSRANLRVDPLAVEQGRGRDHGQGAAAR